LEQIEGISIKPASVVTNIVIFDISGTHRPSSETAEKLRAEDILAIGISDTQMRMVTHLDVSTADIDQVLSSLRSILS
jgi:threonine aldolase